MQHCEEIPAELFKSGCEPAHVLHFAKEPLDHVAHGIKVRVVRDQGFGIGFRRDHRQRALVRDLLADGGSRQRKFLIVLFLSKCAEGWP